jgi:hypothetical protein
MGVVVVGDSGFIRAGLASFAHADGHEAGGG